MLPFGRYEELPAGRLTGKIFADAPPTTYPGRDDEIYLGGLGSSEVKALVSRLIGEIGFAPVDTGTLAEGRKQEPGSPIYDGRMTEGEAREALAALR